MSETPRGPVLIEIDETDGAPVPGPADAPPIPEAASDLPQGRAMQSVVVFGAGRGARIGRFFWSAFGGFVTFAATVAAWDFVTSMFARNSFLGFLALGLLGAVLLAVLLFVLREAAGYFRLSRLDRIHRDAVAATATAELAAARNVVDRLESLYSARKELELPRGRVAARAGEQFDADALLGLAEAELMAPLDAAARAEVERAARQVATVTAIVPLALADVATAALSTMRMIRRIGEIYGGRAGTLGSLRLTRAVLTHLVATGAVAVGDDMIQSVAGGGLLSRLSRRFGEGVVNGALTARVGVAAIEVCRPLPFVRLARPSVSRIVKRALTGLFGSSGEASAADQSK
ncbi:YcjF family protein [Tropicimonas sp. IMCC6043]|uniref:YcjF family protein n=1 Tax=Tropicimonas sp. IMCC6043 TaxID=2510645 RepID=UPI00101BF506|nr:TIGR01620 family protein [Tropicimonas sp. IMCC6043]RYH10360.1 TIGR01620 family protein [Tropicimonas sp. IMCC6043]